MTVRNNAQSRSYVLKNDCAFVTAHLEIFHYAHNPVTPESDSYFTFCSTLKPGFHLVFVGL